MAARDYYGILSVKSDASDEEIKWREDEGQREKGGTQWETKAKRIRRRVRNRR
jgi:hypothetical protein